MIKVFKRRFLVNSVALTIRNTLKRIFKNLGAFILGGTAGVIILFIFLLKKYLEGAATAVGMGIIALAPVLVIIYSITYFVLGGFSGLILYRAYKFWKRKTH